MFGRKKESAADAAAEHTPGGVDSTPDDDANEAASPELLGTLGPWDVDALPEDDTRERLDLGAIRVALAEGMQIRVDSDPATGVPAVVTLIVGEGAAQLQVYAAPRTAGIWDEVRVELLAELAKQQVTGREVDGAFGPAIEATVSVTPESGEPIAQPVRFMGVDGPRWFLRVALTGQALADGEVHDQLIALVRDCVVCRGSEAMAPRDLIPLRVPTEPEATPEAPETAEGNTLNPFKRGPEITEIR